MHVYVADMKLTHVQVRRLGQLFKSYIQSGLMPNDSELFDQTKEEVLFDAVPMSLMRLYLRKAIHQQARPR